MKKEKNLVSVEEFAELSSEFICQILRKKKNSKIVGDTVSIDRMIVEFN